MPRTLKKRLMNKGIYNTVDSEDIPQDAASNSLGFITDVDGFELTRGQQLIGNETTGSDKVPNYHFAYTKAATLVQFRRINTAIQYLNSSDVWTNVITGLTAGNALTMLNVVSLSGRFVFVFGLDGIWKIPVSSPASAVDMFDETKNYKGLAEFDKGRVTLWGREADKTGSYLSHIDEQNWTTVSAEALDTGDGTTTAFSGTLAAISGTKTAFALEITDTVETFIDNGDGVLVGDQGGTGTINYATGAWAVTFNTAPANSQAITGDYQWEDSNDGGITDFTFTTPTRIAGEGDTFRHDKGGDEILNDILLEGSHFFIKKTSIYRLVLSADDLDADNNVYREGVGIPSKGAAVGTSKGIMFMNTADPDQPVLERLTRNTTGDNFSVDELFPQFDFSPFVYDDCIMETWGDYILIACKASDSSGVNDRIILVNPSLNSVDVVPYRALSFAKDSGFIYIGDSISGNTYQVFSGFDDDGTQIEGFWEGNAEIHETERLKRIRLAQFQGLIALDQSYDVEVEYDDGGFEVVATIDGRGSYVDVANPTIIGSSRVGSKLVGGDTAVTVYKYFREIKVKSTKFRKRVWRIVPKGTGYLKVLMIKDEDVLFYQHALPKKYREKNT